MYPSRWNPCCVFWSQWQDDLALKMLICISPRGAGPAYRNWRRVVLYTLENRKKGYSFHSMDYSMDIAVTFSHFCKRKWKLGNKEEHIWYGYYSNFLSCSVRESVSLKHVPSSVESLETGTLVELPAYKVPFHSSGARQSTGDVLAVYKCRLSGSLQIGFIFMRKN